MLGGILPQHKKILCHRWAVFKEYKDTVDFSETLNRLFLSSWRVSELVGYIKGVLNLNLIPTSYFHII